MDLAAAARADGLTLPVRLVVRDSAAPGTALHRHAVQRSRKSISPARGTTSVSGSAANSAGFTDAGSR